MTKKLTRAEFAKAMAFSVDVSDVQEELAELGIEADFNETYWGRGNGTFDVVGTINEDEGEVRIRVRIEAVTDVWDRSLIADEEQSR